MAPATTYDFLMRKLGTPEATKEFLANPNSLHDAYHFTPTNVHEVYDTIDPLKNPKLSQEGKVVFITGANRGIGRVGASHISHPPLSPRDLGSMKYFVSTVLFNPLCIERQ